jgi:hypothetical protein
MSALLILSGILVTYELIHIHYRRIAHSPYRVWYTTVTEYFK